MDLHFFTHLLAFEPRFLVMRTHAPWNMDTVDRSYRAGQSIDTVNLQNGGNLLGCSRRMNIFIPVLTGEFAAKTMEELSLSLGRDATHLSAIVETVRSAKNSKHAHNLQIERLASQSASISLRFWPHPCSPRLHADVQKSWKRNPEPPPP